MSGKRLDINNVPAEYKDKTALYVCITDQQVRLNSDPKNPRYIDDTTTGKDGRKFAFTLAHLRPFERWYMCASKKVLMLHSEWKTTAAGKEKVAGPKRTK